MSEKRNRRRSVAWGVLCLLGVALPALAGERVIRSGVDLWATAGGEMTFTSFASDPVPAGFFCDGSQPFADKVTFRGRPLATEPAGALGAIDTIVLRLDDAAFDADKIARTRIRLMALSLEATEPIETSCGRYDVEVSLAGEQPLTEMTIYRTSEWGGVYRAPLALDVEMAFRPVAGNPHPARELVRRVDLGPGTNSVWSDHVAGRGPEIHVDTDGDRVPDTVLPAESNFLAGVSPSENGPRQGRIELVGGVPACPSPLCPVYTCHCTPMDDDPTYDEPAGECESDHLHCTWVCAQLPNQACATPIEL